MIRAIINAETIEVEPGTTVLQAARALGHEIPTLCHHDMLKPAGACRLCVVEEQRKDWSHLVTSCSTPVREDATYDTGSESVIRARKLMIGLMLSRWPNVPVLRSLAEQIGVEKPLFDQEEYQEMEEDACIRCGMCIRVCDEVVGAHALSWDGRGTERMVTTPYHEYSDTCIVCGSCATVCPTSHLKLRDVEHDVVLRHSEIDLGPNSAIHPPTMQAIPNAPFIDTEACIHFQTGGCGYCEQVCEPEAIRFDQQEEVHELEVGSVILSSGFQQFDPEVMRQYGYGEFPNVITGIEFEKMNCASGSTGGQVLCEDGTPPESVAILHCIGSRDKNYHEYCSKVCCMYALKFAHLVKEKTEAEVYNLYIDMRCPGKGYEEFYDRLLHEDIRFIRGKGAEVTRFPHYESEKDSLIVRCEDTLTSTIRRIPVDMVILCAALEPRADASALARMFGVSTDKHGWMIEKHPKLAPVETASAGVFVAGASQGPKDIPETVAQASAAASMALQNIGKGEVELEGYFAEIDEEKCCGCRVCNELCPYGAIVYDVERKVSLVEDALCKACGTCVSACPSSSITAKHFKDEQILAELEGILS